MVGVDLTSEKRDSTNRDDWPPPVVIGTTTVGLACEISLYCKRKETSITQPNKIISLLNFGIYFYFLLRR